MQTFSIQVAQFLSQQYLDKKLFEKVRHISCTLWSKKWICGLNSFKSDALLAQDCMTNGVAVKLSTIKHEQSLMGCFPTQDMGKVELVGNHYGTILSCTFKVPWSGNYFAEGLMSVSKYDFQKWAFPPGQNVKSSDVQTFLV